MHGNLENNYPKLTRNYAKYTCVTKTPQAPTCSHKLLYVFVALQFALFRRFSLLSSRTKILTFGCLSALQPPEPPPLVSVSLEATGGSRSLGAIDLNMLQCFRRSAPLRALRLAHLSKIAQRGLDLLQNRWLQGGDVIRLWNRVLRWPSVGGYCYSVVVCHSIGNRRAGRCRITLLC